MRGETGSRTTARRGDAISIHSPHARGDNYTPKQRIKQHHFNPLPSCEGRQYRTSKLRTKLFISIHSPHTRGDRYQDDLQLQAVYFNPLPSYEGRLDFARAAHPAHVFQSTPLMRGETRVQRSGSRPGTDFNPLPSCEGRRNILKDSADRVRISIHSPHARGDPLSILCTFTLLPFQSTPLMRGETFAGLRRAEIAGLFQSTPLMRGETLKSGRWTQKTGDFNPLPSCEGRPGLSSAELVDALISIHSPHARGDLRSARSASPARISIHSPHARGDAMWR